MDDASFRTLLRSGRTSRGWTLDRLGRLVGAVGTTVGRWERGEYLPPREVAVSLDRELGYGSQLMRAWQIEKTGSPLPPWAHDIALLEERARLIELISPHLVPGLLQCTEYMRLMMGRNLIPAADIARLVDARSRRLEALIANGLASVTAVFPAFAVDRLPTDVRREQAARLLELTDAGHVDVHLIMDEDTPIGLMGPLMMFHLREGGAISASEHNRGVIVHDEASDIGRLHHQIKAALGRSLPAAASRRFLEEVR
ncbi:helix-turn-helix transcriptional regulator [Nocardiopsis sp. NRRL B-16309]|uniref:helix-turn-helix domain-containing protein n=1 Tax=Nocardiopsis sp. NRRL B-16309 TaxID=1519494 RepID=UPI0006B06B77|nr:helix-turn-helix transcriptional regulator [Nocardiopsis sp. NRRL B-16309]